MNKNGDIIQENIAHQLDHSICSDQVIINWSAQPGTDSYVIQWKNNQSIKTPSIKRQKPIVKIAGRRRVINKRASKCCDHKA